jgi:ABC-type Fe3+/spermidine/putrescine transport system ATPase subunit
MGMASRLAVMKDGTIVQTGTPHEVYERPATRFVADFIGIANILESGPGRWLALRPEKIALNAQRPEAAHVMAGRIVDIAYEGGRSLYRVAVDEGRIMVVSGTNVVRTQEGPFRRGQDVWLSWATDAGQVLDK